MGEKALLQRYYHNFNKHFHEIDTFQQQFKRDVQHSTTFTFDNGYYLLDESPDDKEGAGKTSLPNIDTSTLTPSSSPGGDISTFTSNSDNIIQGGENTPNFTGKFLQRYRIWHWC